MADVYKLTECERPEVVIVEVEGVQGASSNKGVVKEIGRYSGGVTLPANAVDKMAMAFDEPVLNPSKVFVSITRHKYSYPQEGDISKVVIELESVDNERAIICATNTGSAPVVLNYSAVAMITL